MSEKRDSSKGPIRPGINQQDPKSFNEAPNQKQEQQWRERQHNDPMKQPRAGLGTSTTRATRGRITHLYYKTS